MARAVAVMEEARPGEAVEDRMEVKGAGLMGMAITVGLVVKKEAAVTVEVVWMAVIGVVVVREEAA